MPLPRHVDIDGVECSQPAQHLGCVDRLGRLTGASGVCAPHSAALFGIVETDMHLGTVDVHDPAELLIQILAQIELCAGDRGGRVGCVSRSSR